MRQKDEAYKYDGQLRRRSNDPLSCRSPASASSTSHRLSLGRRVYWDTGDTGRHHVKLHIGAFDVSATDHYLRNETLCLSEKTARDGLGMEEDGGGKLVL